MNILSWRLIAMSLVAVTLACGGEVATALRETAPSVSSPPRVVALSIAPDSAVMTLGAGLSLTAIESLSNGSRVTVRADWYSSNYEIVMINGASLHARAVGPGQAVIMARADGLVAFAPVMVLPPKLFGPSEALVIESFFVTEHQYESAPNQWYYAPQLRVRASSGRSLSVLVLRFTIPGVGYPPSWGCGATITSAGRELNGEVYGDWAFEIGGDGPRASRDDATAVVTFVDDAGTMDSRTVHGPVVGGSGPGTYGGDSGACFQGIGSGG